MGIADNYRLIAERVSRTAVACGRDPGSVKIVAVSKTHPADAIAEAQTGGAIIFGENKVQEAKEKFPLLKGPFEFHLVGHLQSNKAKEAVRMFDLIHSIDSFSTAQKVDREAAALGKKQRILV
ncbi:MAG TPA: alanine racemase, partial [Spirochaetota bacterium]|nr:alanine racemase [Spirochaetota bacterium]